MAYREDWYEAEQLHRAAGAGDIPEMEKLAAAGFDVNMFDDTGRTPLHFAVEGEHYRAAEWLLMHGADVNSHDENMIGETPLCFAVQRDYPELVELLLRHGADPDIAGWMGNTARMRAQRRKDAEGRKIADLIAQRSVPGAPGKPKGVA